ncbi:succinyldiaminopimelate transaminase [Cycloclasticus pugetii]|uniref:succinyldiaminopimelate transaminase n=1 Tax=Cycloclasticus pugetii TaxID=34068 RepID=UPI00036929CB|nr:succinyldiaminopimelate transaminase [Cycloclasticus pugetii]
MNPDLASLQPYPFEKLAKLKHGITPPNQLEHIALSVGEPKHPTPQIITDALLKHLHTLGQYPTTKGLDELRQSIAAWLSQRFDINPNALDPNTHILPVSGTREALFSFAQCVVQRSDKAIVAMPNPFYQIYEGATLLAGAKPFFINCDQENNYLPDYDKVSTKTWKNCQLLYICNPGNPSGANHTEAQLRQLIELAHRYDFIIAADECYSEIYTTEHNRPLGLLEVSQNMGNTDFSRCVVFHSLSKRSNAPGLRSGFIAGDAKVLKSYFNYRTYHGCTMPTPTQHASIAAWGHEEHVNENRILYAQKFKDVLSIIDDSLDVKAPDAGFYLWAKTPISDIDFAQQLFEKQHITVLPGQFLARNTNDGNPGLNHIRMALVAPVGECLDAAHRIKQFIQTL